MINFLSSSTKNYCCSIFSENTKKLKRKSLEEKYITKKAMSNKHNNNNNDL